MVKKVFKIDPSGSQDDYKLRFNLQNMVEDVWVPHRTDIIPLTEDDLLKISKKSAKSIGLPKRIRFKKFRQWLDELWWNVKMTFLWLMVKLKLFNFYRWKAMCMNRKLI